MILLLCALVLTLTKASIIMDLQPQTAACPNQTLFFTCNTSEDSLTWKVGYNYSKPCLALESSCQGNMTLPNGAIAVYEARTFNGSFSSTLTFQASPHLDNLNIDCFSSMDNKTKTIRVANSKPSNLTSLDFSEESGILSWFYPANGDYIDYYTVRVGDHYFTTTETFLNIAEHNFSRDRAHNVTVQATNCIGSTSEIYILVATNYSAAHIEQSKFTSCNTTYLSREQILIASTAWSYGAFISFVACTIAIALHLFQQKKVLFHKINASGSSDHERAAHRNKQCEAVLTILILLSTMFFNLVNIPQAFIYYNQAPPDCSILGYLFQVASDAVLVTMLCILTYLYLRKYQPQLNNKAFYIICLVAFSCAVVLIAHSVEPHIAGEYGDSGAWCWIKNGCKSASSGFMHQMILWYVLIVSLLVFTFILLCESSKYLGYPFYCILWFYLVTFLLAIFSGLLNRVLSLKEYEGVFFILILQAVAYTVWPLSTAIIVIFSSKSTLP